MAFKPPKVTQDEVSQTIDLSEAFGIDFKGLDSLKQIIAEDMIERIRARTEGGNGVKFSSNGNASNVTFPGYSKDYIDSPEFRAFGKSKGKVNLKLTGDMLNLIDLTDETKDTITIGWDDSEQNAKAFNHITGDTVKPRPFFGITKSELQEIVKAYKPKIKEIIKVERTDGKKAAEEKLLDLIDEINDGE
jgi:hypothetical protein